MPGGGCGLDRPGEGREPVALRSSPSGGCSPRCGQIQALSAAGRSSGWLAAIEPEDVAGCDLVIAATNDREVNRAVFEEASRRSILCNTADDPPLCDFFFASIVQRGDLQIAISTAGQSPALAQRLRREIDAQLPPDLGPWLDELGQLRREVLQVMPAGAERKALLHDSGASRALFGAGLPARAWPLRESSSRCRSEKRRRARSTWWERGLATRICSPSRLQGYWARRAWCCMTTWCPNPS